MGKKLRKGQLPELILAVSFCIEQAQVPTTHGWYHIDHGYSCTLVRVDTPEERETTLITQNDIDSPIFRLPSELLCAIFLIVSRTSRNRTWLHILHVCRYWRTTAIHYPLLWTRIPDVGPHNRSLRLFMLKHSQPLPISLRGIRITKGSTKAETRESRKVLETNLDRIEELEVVFSEACSTAEMEVWLRRLLDPSFSGPGILLPPLLKKLDITLRLSKRTEHWIKTPNQVTETLEVLTVNGRVERSRLGKGVDNADPSSHPVEGL